jgi:hypothetical protein
LKQQQPRGKNSQLNIAMLSKSLNVLFAYSSIIAGDAFVPQTASTSSSPFRPTGANAANNVPGGKTTLSSSPFDNMFGGLFGDKNKDDRNPREEEEDDAMSLSSFQQELSKRQQLSKDEAPSPLITENPNDDDDDEFSGYDLRDIIYSKYGECFDVMFQRVDSYGVRAVYLVSCVLFCIKSLDIIYGVKEA